MEADDDTSTAPSQGQLETLGSLLTGLANQQGEAGAAHQAGDTASEAATQGLLSAEGAPHRVIMRDGTTFEGTWEELVKALRG